jgi:hypothetical protein
VLARSLPFKGLRKRTPDPDEVQPGGVTNGNPVHPTDES